MTMPRTKVAVDAAVGFRLPPKPFMQSFRLLEYVQTAHMLSLPLNYNSAPRWKDELPIIYILDFWGGGNRGQTLHVRAAGRAAAPLPNRQNCSVVCDASSSVAGIFGHPGWRLLCQEMSRSATAGTDCSKD